MPYGKHTRKQREMSINLDQKPAFCNDFHIDGEDGALRAKSFGAN